MIEGNRMSCAGSEPADHHITVATLFMDIDTPAYTYGLFREDFTAKPSAAAFGDFTTAVGQ